MTDLRPVPRIIQYIERFLISNRLWLLSAIPLTITAATVYQRPGRIVGDHVTTYVTAAVFLATSLVLLAVANPKNWQVTVGFTVMSGSAGVLAVAVPASWAIIMPYVVASVATRRYPTIVAIWVNAAAIATVTVVQLIEGSALSGLTAVTILLVFSMTAFARRTREERLEQVELALAREQAAREEHTRAAALAERARIAREVHDVLAHSLSALSLNLQGARLMLARDGASEEAQEQVRRAQRLAAEGLAQARRAVAALRDDPVPAARAITDLVTQSRLETGTPANLLVEGTPRDLPGAAEDALFRTTQEALSNARKHAPGAPIQVTLAYLDGRTELTVRDCPGHRAAEPTPGGYGLIGMRERAELIGGELRTGPTEDGWQVRLVVPV